MSCEIIRNLMNHEKKKVLKLKINDTSNLSQNIENNKTTSKEIKQSTIKKSRNNFNEDQLSKCNDSNFGIKNINNDILYNKAFTSINYLNIIKAYFCFKDNKKKLIDCCHKIINEDMCIENILKRLYLCETKNNYLLDNKSKNIDYIK